MIVIGELRDNESVSLALTAAETGHIVLGTINSTSAPKAIDRIISRPLSRYWRFSAWTASSRSSSSSSPPPGSASWASSGGKLKPVTATVIILTSVTVWNEYALSVFVLRDPAVRTIAPTIGTFFASQGSNLGAAAAAALLSVLPLLIAYLVLQRFFIKGMVAGSEK